MLERWVSETYKNIGINTPSDIDIERICERRNITYKETPFPSHYVIADNYQFIFTNQFLDETNKKEQFLHELAHIEFHSGLQPDLSKEQHFLQERDARNFTKYALIPFHMLHYIDYESEFIIEEVMEIFNVSEKISVERLLDIKRSVLNNKVLVSN